MAAKEYERAGVRRDSVCQPLRNRAMAERCAEILERMTGECCTAISRGPCHIVERVTEEGKVVRG
jgi:hypothetical protein